ncbi:class V chitinase-like [Pistacia vera]|uniref:class V chitinase-like n=1 Tax=Pistacia vera TaxID=55513 RepID=UPI0012631B6C|nr:class V chitinase-like [Pistacia vera]
MVSNSFYRKSFIDSSIQVARLYGFQGLDFFWYYVITKSDMFNMGILFEEWRAAIQLEAKNSSQSELIFTAAVYYSTSTPSGSTYSVNSIAQYLDWVHVLASEYSRPGRYNFTGVNAALYDPAGVKNTDYGIREWINAGLSANKLVLLLPFYGCEWTLVNSKDDSIGAPAAGPANKTTYGFLTYKEIKDEIQRHGPNVQVIYNETYVVNYFTIGTSWINFDDVEAIKAKVSYAKEKGLLGYVAWQVSFDDNWALSEAAASKKLCFTHCNL